jgi:hypothetical protein
MGKKDRIEKRSKKDRIEKKMMRYIVTCSASFQPLTEAIGARYL